MPTYLMTWNPNNWNYETLQDDVERVRKGKKPYDDRWSSGKNKSIRSGSRVFLIRLGKSPKGIMASGWTASDVFEDSHWDERLGADGKKALYVKIDWDILLDPEEEAILSREQLSEGILGEMHWDSQASGITIRDDIARELVRRWSQFLSNRGLDQKSIPEEELSNQTLFVEGAVRRIELNTHERNQQARGKCLRAHGYDCAVCGFNFEKTFGEIGAEFIHVHHLKAIAGRKRAYKLDAINDLRPICPNCHSMIHRKNPPLSIEALKKIIKKNSTESH